VWRGTFFFFDSEFIFRAHTTRVQRRTRIVRIMLGRVCLGRGPGGWLRWGVVRGEGVVVFVGRARYKIK
jgi:hypothetical protein